jgi:hypothetical protein
MYVQNTSASAGTVSVSYFDVNGNGTSKNFAIAAGGSVTIDQTNANAAPPPSAAAYTASISAAVPIAAVVFDVPPTGATGALAATAYDAIPQSSIKATFPVVQNGTQADFSTSLWIMSAYSYVASVTVTYYDAATGSYLKSAQYDIGGDNLLTLSQTADLQPGQRATAIVTSTPGAPIAAIALEQGTGQLMTYNGQ